MSEEYTGDLNLDIDWDTRPGAFSVYLAFVATYQDDDGIWLEELEVTTITFSYINRTKTTVKADDLEKIEVSDILDALENHLVGREGILSSPDFGERDPDEAQEDR